MSCYIRHLDPILEQLGLENTKENRKLLDLKIRKALVMEDSHCPEIWAKLKEIMASDEEFSILIEKIK